MLSIVLFLIFLGKQSRFQRYYTRQPDYMQDLPSFSLPCLLKMFYNKKRSKRRITMHSEPLVSIIIPVYNAKEYLRRCVDSVLNQEFRNFELILANDGSTDGSGAICDDYRSRDSRVHVIHKENTGVSDTRNRALLLARGVYIQFIDSDDWITPEATHLLIRSMEQYPATWSYLISTGCPATILHTKATSTKPGC